MADTSYYGRASTESKSNRPVSSAAAGGGGGGGGLDQGKIFVGGLSWQTTEESLRWHFEQYGPVVSVEVMRDRVTGDPRRFAFVVFQDATTVDLVMAEPNHEINHKIVDVKRAQARGVAPPSIHEKLGGQSSSASQDGTTVVDPRFDPSKAGMPSSNNNNHNSNNNAPKLTPEQQGCKVFVGGTLVGGTTMWSAPRQLESKSIVSHWKNPMISFYYVFFFPCVILWFHRHSSQCRSRSTQGDI